MRRDESLEIDELFDFSVPTLEAVKSTISKYDINLKSVVINEETGAVEHIVLSDGTDLINLLPKDSYSKNEPQSDEEPFGVKTDDSGLPYISGNFDKLSNLDPAVAAFVIIHEIGHLEDPDYIELSREMSMLTEKCQSHSRREDTISRIRDMIRIGNILMQNEYNAAINARSIASKIGYPMDVFDVLEKTRMASYKAGALLFQLVGPLDEAVDNGFIEDTTLISVFVNGKYEKMSVKELLSRGSGIDINSIATPINESGTIFNTRSGQSVNTIKA